MAASSDYRLGSIWLVSFDPAIGTEIRKTRPAVIVSGTIFNQRSKVTVLPITASNPSDRLLPVILPLTPDARNGLSSNSYVVCIDPMTFVDTPQSEGVRIPDSARQLTRQTYIYLAEVKLSTGVEIPVCPTVFFKPRANIFSAAL